MLRKIQVDFQQIIFGRFFVKFHFAFERMYTIFFSGQLYFVIVSNMSEILKEVYLLICQHFYGNHKVKKKKVLKKLVLCSMLRTLLCMSMYLGSAIEKKAPTTTDCGTSHNGGTLKYHEYLQFAYFTHPFWLEWG